MVIIALVATSLAAGGVFAVVLSPPPSPCSGVSGAARSITIVADLNGYKGSKSQTGPWPVTTVHECDRVEITIINNDTQAHGFAVTYYSNSDLEIVGGTPPHTFKFPPTQISQSTTYCSTC